MRYRYAFVRWVKWDGSIAAEGSEQMDGVEFRASLFDVFASAGEHGWACVTSFPHASLKTPVVFGDKGKTYTPTDVHDLEPASTPGEFRVHLDTETPGFDTFLAQIDGGEESPVAAIFPWKLHPGRNRLKVWPRNNARRNGIASWIELEMPAM